MTPTDNAGKINDSIAEPGAPQPSRGNPCEGKTPISPTPRPNSRISSNPPHKAGMAPPLMASTWNTERTRSERASTAAQPSGRPMTKAINMPRMIRGKVMAAREPTSEVTERPVRMDVPKSPWISAPIQSKYCATNGRFKPSCSRNWATRSGGELTPAITEATSPGRMRNAAKITTDRPSSATTNNASRLSTNRIMPTLLGVTFLWLPSVAYGDGSPSLRGAVAQRLRRGHRRRMTEAILSPLRGQLPPAGARKNVTTSG